MHPHPVEARLLAEEHMKRLRREAEQTRLIQMATGSKKTRRHRPSLKTILASLLAP